MWKILQSFCKYGSYGNSCDGRENTAVKATFLDYFTQYEKCVIVMQLYYSVIVLHNYTLLLCQLSDF